jgi:hypothetical protein
MPPVSQQWCNKVKVLSNQKGAYQRPGIGLLTVGQLITIAIII